MKRSGFTLVELLVIIGIIATMVTVAVVSIRQGQGAARQRGAARDVFAVIRHARSVALVSEEPSIITFSSSYKDGGVVSKIEIVASKKLSGSYNDTVQTIYGEHVRLNETEEETQSEEQLTYDESDDASQETIKETKGLAIEDYLFETVSEDVLTDVRILVEMTGDGSELVDDRGMKRSNISAFSNVDYLLGKYQQAKDESKASADEDFFGSEFDDSFEEFEEDPLPEPVKIVWQANGMCDPHRIWVYLDGTEKESGLVINVDMFGGVKVLTAEELMNL